MFNNVPSDWAMYYRTCSYCRTKYHASEGECYKCEELEELINTPVKKKENYDRSIDSSSLFPRR